MVADYFDAGQATSVLRLVILVGGPYLLKYWLSNPTGGFKSRSKEEKTLEFLSSFLAFDFTKRNPIVVEQAFRFAFKQKLKYVEIAQLMSFLSPMHAFHLYRSAKQFVGFETSKGPLIYRGRYENERFRTRMSKVLIASYFGFAYSGFLILMYGLEVAFARHNPLLGGLVSFASIMLFSLAYVCVDHALSLQSLKKFIQEYQLAKQTSDIPK